MRVLLGMSGGVDSTYCAHVLLESGYEVEAAVLVMSDDTDVGAAVDSCSDLGIKLHIIDAKKSFKKHVIDNFVEEYCKARTPNPCVMCNRYVKIKLLCDFAIENGFDKIATGHYCDIVYENGRYGVKKGDDLRKDQSYMLWQLTQSELSMLITPLAHYYKDKVKKDAFENNLKAAIRPESQEICFIPDDDYVSYIENIKGKFPKGDFIDLKGNKVGEHNGIIRYTVGQRKGLGLSMNAPVFVTKIDPAENTVQVSYAGGEYSDEFRCDNLNFQSFCRPQETEKVKKELLVKIRYAAKPVPAIVEYTCDNARVVFKEPQRAVTPGQSAVFYVNDTVAFGGFIC